MFFHRFTLVVASTVLLATAAQAASINAGAIQPQINRPEEKPAQNEPLLSIPAVIDRPLKVDEGEKIQVTHFEIQGAVDHPDDGLYVKDFEKILEEYKSQHPDGLTVGQLQEAANQVRDAYRKAGYPIAQAFVPAQDVQGGVVKISVLEGVLGDVVVEKNTLYSETMISQGVGDVVGKPVHVDSLESALMTVNDYPGVDVLGVLRPGKNVGEAELVLQAQNEDPYAFFISTDNQGTESSGQSRLFGGVTANNLMGWADSLDVIFLQTFDPTDSLYGSINYEAQTPLPSLRAGGGYSTNSYSVGEAYSSLPVTGDTEQINAYLRNSWMRSRALSMSSTFDLAAKRAELRDDDTDDLVNRDELAVASLSFDIDFVDARFHGVNRLSTVFSRGLKGMLGAMDADGGTADGMYSSRQGGDGTYAGAKFEKITTNYTRVQAMPFSSQLQLRASGQYTDDMLVSLEQFSLGGPNSVRAYPVSEYLFDKGWFASAEWFFDAPFFADKDAFAGHKWGDILRVSAFVDYGGGINNNPTKQEVTLGVDTLEVSGAGVGIALNVSKAFFIKAEAATPIGHYDASNDRNPQYWLSAGLEF